MKRGMASLAARVMLAGAMAALLGGCLPVELSVSPQGEILIPRQEGFVIMDSAKGEAKVALKTEGAAFGVFAPDGKDFAAVVKSGEFQVRRVSRDGTAKDLFALGNMTYLRWSPDGKSISVTRIADQQNEAVKEQLPELILASAADGTRKTLLNGCSMIHRWTSDSKSILAVQITGKIEDKDRYTGQLVLVDAADGKAKPLCAVVSEKKMFVDLSPDGKKALLVAIKLGKTGEKLTVADEKPQLFEVSLADGAFRSVREGAAYGIYSPNGSKVLVGIQEGSVIQLEVGDAEMKTMTVVARDAARSAGEGPESADIYPGWVNDATVHYLRLRLVYGTAGKNLQLVTVGVDGQKVTNLQCVIDSAIK